MCPFRDTCPGVVYGSVTEVTCGACSKGTSALATCARTAGEVLVQQVLPGVGTAERVVRRGAEPHPQRNQHHYSHDPREQGRLAVPVKGSAKAAEQAVSRLHTSRVANRPLNRVVQRKALNSGG